MAQAVTRRQFLRGDLSRHPAAVRPPWAVEETRFSQLCTRCNACLEACGENILISDEHGLPRVDFRRGECLLCGECLAACREGALRDNDQATAWHLKAHIETGCLPVQGIYCCGCLEHCESRAIRFQHRVGNVPLPTVQTELCNGCGACYRICPANAIRMQYTDNDNTRQSTTARS